MTTGMERSLGKIEGQLQLALEKLENLDKRMTSVESQMKIWQGSLIIIGTAIAMFGSKIGDLFGVRIS